MGDPWSVAGSAVGIISLGIQVCQGLIGYADGIKGRQQDLDDGMNEARSLLTVFKSLEQTIARIETDSPENARTLLEHLRQAEGKLQSLKEVLEEVGVPVNTSSGAKGKMKETYRAAIYPMKKSKLEGARRNVQSLLSILTTALQTVDLDLGGSQADTLKALQSTTRSDANELKAAAETSSSQLANLQVTSQREFSNLSNSLTSARTEAQEFSNRSASQLASIGSNAKEGFENTQLILEMMRDLSLQINAASTVSGRAESRNQNGLLLVKLGTQVPPDSLKRACDLHASEADLVCGSARDIANNSLPPRPRPRYCKCPPRLRNKDDFLSRPSWKVYFEQTTVSEHVVGCPFARFAGKSSMTKAGARFHVPLGGLFSTLVDVSMCLRTGAGGFSLSPSLRYMHIMDRCGPVHRLIMECFRRTMFFDISRRPEIMVDRLRCMRKQITRCFEQGTASPRDRTTDNHRHYWAYLLNDIRWLCCHEDYEEQALWVALDTLKWLAEAGAPETSNQDAKDMQVKSCFPLRQIPDLAKHANREKCLSIILNVFKLLLDTFELDDEHLVQFFFSADQGMDLILPLVQSYIPFMDVSPMARAILYRSMPQLEYQINFAPESVLETTYGCTTLQLARAWPQGFARLLQTSASALVHEPILSGKGEFSPYITSFSDPSVLDALLTSGCTLFPSNSHDTLRRLLKNSRIAVAQVIAKHLADRLRRLSELASNFGIASNDDDSIPDFATAASWCLDLEELGVSIDPSIRVPMSDGLVSTVYHYIPFSVFPIFYEHGFVHVNTCDQRGLPPMFVNAPLLFIHDACFFSQRIETKNIGFFHMIPWLSQHGFLSQKPRDPQELGTNVDATGAHHVAAAMGMTCFILYNNQQDMDRVLELAAGILQRLARDPCLDNCVCWCHSGGEGCSPLKLLYKTHAHERSGICVYKSGKFQAASINRLLFDFAIFEDPTATTSLDGKEGTLTQPSARALELVRLLTFEALQMNHTCCIFQSSCIDDKWLNIIMSCDPNTVRDVRNCDVEKKNAALLDVLMDEFCNTMQRDYRGKPLLEFIFSYLVPRIEELYAVDQNEVQKMQHHVGNVRTGVWPRPLRRLLWPTDPLEDSYSESDDE